MAKEPTTNVVGKYYTDGRIEEVTEKMTLKAMQEFVGGYIEYVKVTQAHRALIVNDEGFLQQLPHNVEATRLVNRSVWMHGGIHGKALLIKT